MQYLFRRLGILLKTKMITRLISHSDRSIKLCVRYDPITVARDAGIDAGVLRVSAVEAPRDDSHDGVTLVG